MLRAGEGLRRCRVDTPLGPMTLETEGGAVTALFFTDDPAPCVPPREGLEAEAAAQLEQYFAGERQSFELPLAPEGTPFQQRVWDALREIPYGETRSYAQIARVVGSPGAARAVGGACHRNPIALLTPCHRVLGADGSLTGFGAGIERKRRLLMLEGVRL